MRKIAAELRHRELTQEIYKTSGMKSPSTLKTSSRPMKIGTMTCHICLAELGDIIEDARVDSGRCVGELIGLRQALVSGLRSGTISCCRFWSE